jgi:hypothetical protein
VRCGGLANSACDLLPHDRENSLRAPAIALYDTFELGAPVYRHAKRLTENELSDFSRLWHDGCGKAIIEIQDVDRNHSPEI